MANKICPHCLEEMVSEALGWMCRRCRGLIDMQGVFHEYEKRPFMPPLTNGDRFRAKVSSDEGLCELIFKLELDEKISFCEERKECLEKIEQGNFDAIGEDCKKCLMRWLRQPADGSNVAE